MSPPPRRARIPAGASWSTLPEGSLLSVLERSAAYGFLGPGPLVVQIEHARGFAAATPRSPTAPDLACDLGSGGGLPGLVLAAEVWPESRWVLLEGMEKRCELLRWAISELGLGERVSVVHGRVEHLGRPGEPLRAACTLVTSRSFGPPRVTAEAGAPLLVAGGTLVVSEPPESQGQRWRAAGLSPLGLSPTGVVRTDSAGYMVLTQTDPCPPEYPRPWKRQSRQRLF